MKLNTLLLLIIIAGGSYFYWTHQRDNGHSADIVEQEEVGHQEHPTAFMTDIQPAETPPIVVEEVLPEIPEEAEPEEAEPEPEISLQSLIADILQRQRVIEVPHALDNAVTASGAEYEQAVVFRIEPDGINIRHLAGLTKIPIEDMQPEWLEEYAMNPLVAREYRARQAQRDRAAWEAARERQRIERERHAESVQRGEAAREARSAELARQRETQDIARRRAAWAKYDRDYEAWRTSRSRWDRNVIGRPKPQEPPFPRP